MIKIQGLVSEMKTALKSDYGVGNKMYLFNSCKINVIPVNTFEYQSKIYFYKGIVDNDGNDVMLIVVFQ